MAVDDVEEVLVERDSALIAALSRLLGPLEHLGLVHYFHGTRLIRPDLIAANGLLPHHDVLDTLW